MRLAHDGCRCRYTDMSYILYITDNIVLLLFCINAYCVRVICQFPALVRIVVKPSWPRPMVLGGAGQRSDTFGCGQASK